MNYYTEHWYKLDIMPTPPTQKKAQFKINKIKRKAQTKGKKKKDSTREL